MNDNWLLLDLERHPTSVIQVTAATRLRELLGENAQLLQATKQTGEDNVVDKVRKLAAALQHERAKGKETP